MTDTMIDVPGVIAKTDDADFLRELIQDAARRLMEFDREMIDPGDRSQGE